jgi:hypothetical protein
MIFHSTLGPTRRAHHERTHKLLSQRQRPVVHIEVTACYDSVRIQAHPLMIMT